jgi:hypothetical protein
MSRRKRLQKGRPRLCVAVVHLRTAVPTPSRANCGSLTFQEKTICAQYKLSNKHAHVKQVKYDSDQAQSAFAGLHQQHSNGVHKHSARNRIMLTQKPIRHP